jgi:hypothetical protein
MVIRISEKASHRMKSYQQSGYAEGHGVAGHGDERNELHARMRA